MGEKVEIEKRELPKLAMTALTFANANHRANLMEIAEQAREVLGLDASWTIDFDNGIAFKPKDA